MDPVPPEPTLWQVRYRGETIGGRMRIENGTTEPFGVKYWCVGNEMWGNWQLGYMHLDQYVLKHNRSARAMWDVDPDLAQINVQNRVSRALPRLPAEVQALGVRGCAVVADVVRKLAENRIRERGCDPLLQPLPGRDGCTLRGGHCAGLGLPWTRPKICIAHLVAHRVCKDLQEDG